MVKIQNQLSQIERGNVYKSLHEKCDHYLIDLPEQFEESGLLLMQTLLRISTEFAASDYSKIIDHDYFKSYNADSLITKKEFKEKAP